MGFHKTSATRNMRTRHARLDRCEDGSIIARYIDFAYCFIGERKGTLTLKGKEIPKPPAFENISGCEVAFAHRPNPDGWDGKSITTGEVEHYDVQTYGKGGWNIPDVKFWLDCELPKMEE